MIFLCAGVSGERLFYQLDFLGAMTDLEDFTSAWIDVVDILLSR
jgi:hypothetical protein